MANQYATREFPNDRKIRVLVSTGPKWRLRLESEYMMTVHKYSAADVRCCQQFRADKNDTTVNV